MKADTINIPVQATYRITNGEAVKVAAVYANIPASSIARLLLRGFGMPAITEKGEHDKSEP